jgi:DNA glycosylase AlkZ-like
MRSLLLRERDHPSTVDAFRDVASVVTWFGAMQAQDLNSSLWSLGLRLASTTVGDIEAALERREVLRTWPMRGTVHLVPARDAHWMVDILGTRPLAAAARRREQIGLSEQDADHAVDILGAALAGGGRMTRAECVAALEAGGIDGAGQRAYHLLWYASQRGVTCIAPNVDKEQTFVLLDDWVPEPRLPERDEALAIIVQRYFRSHGPATRQDFARWTGLTMSDARSGIAACSEALATCSAAGQDLIADAALLDSGQSISVNEVWNLPGFDEFLLGYGDRSLVLNPTHNEAVLPGGNGVFRSTVVRGGHVVGTWKRSLAIKKVTIEVWPLVTLSATARRRIHGEFEHYARFLGRELQVLWQ